MTTQIEHAKSVMGADWVMRQQAAANPPDRFLGAREAAAWWRACEWLDANKTGNGRVVGKRVPRDIRALCSNADRRKALGLVTRWIWNRTAFYSAAAHWQIRWDALRTATDERGCR